MTNYWINSAYKTLAISPDHQLLITDELQKVICLFRLDFIDQAAVAKAQAGKPVNMAIAMNDEQQLKLKPQNLPFNLPLAKVS